MVLGTLITWRWFPAYPAEAFLELRPPPEEAYAPGEQTVDPRIMELLLQTEARKINRLDVLMQVLSLDEIKNTSFFKWYDSFDECLFDLRDRLRVVPLPDTQIISVGLSCRDRDEAVLIVDTIVKRYLESYRTDAAYAGRQSLEDLKATLAQAEQQLNEKRQELAKFRASTDIGALEAEAEGLGRLSTDQQYLVNTYDAMAADLQAQLAAVWGMDPTQLPITPEDRVIVESDPLLRLYRQTVENMDIQISGALRYLAGENHRQLRLLKANRDGTHQLEVARREELLDDLRERRVNFIKQELTRVRSVQARVQEQLADLMARQRDVDKALVEYQALQADELRLQASLTKIEEKVHEFQHLAQTSAKSPRLTLVQSPRRAVEPSRPDFPVWLGGGVVLALLVSFGLAFVREMTDKAIRTPVDVVRYGRLSVLGCIPLLDEEEADLDAIELATRQAPHSLSAEAFRQVRANLVFSGPAESQRSLLITSPGPAAGKTATAINLAVTLAQANERVLLVDCNFRRPALRAVFANTRPEGLSNVLVGRAKLEEVATATDVPNLHVLTSGPMPPTPAELLGSANMRRLIEEALARYDRVIFDGPPALLISDALVVATQVGGVIVVARAVDTTKGYLRRAREQLEKINARVVGAVLNGVRARPGGYYRQQYREFYEYASEETIPRELPGLTASESGESKSDQDR